MSSQYIRLRRADLYTSITGMKALDLVDEESEECDGEAGDNAADAPQALPEKQENDTE